MLLIRSRNLVFTRVCSSKFQVLGLSRSKMKTMIATLCAGKGLLNHFLLSARLLLAAAVPSNMLVFFLCRESISLIISLPLTRSSVFPPLFLLHSCQLFYIAQLWSSFRCRLFLIRFCSVSCFVIDSVSCSIFVGFLDSIIYLCSWSYSFLSWT
jgi:hypothetical protein